MSCDRWMEAVSAIADGEEPGVDRSLVEAHLRRCPSCRAFQGDVEVNRRAGRVGEAGSIPDLSRRVVKLNAIADRAARWGAVRGLLVVSALQIVALSGPALVLGDTSGGSPHGARHLGAFSVAYAVGLLVVAARPARARTMLPVAGVLGVALVVSAVVDVITGTTAPFGELVHFPELLSVLLVWLLSRPAPARPAGRATGGAIRVAPDDQRRDQAM